MIRTSSLLGLATKGKRRSDTYLYIAERAVAVSHEEGSLIARCGDQFEFALDLMLDRLERLRDST
jgi:hypothetical protein